MDYSLISFLGNVDLNFLEKLNNENIDEKIEYMKKDKKGYGAVLNILLKIFDSNKPYNIKELLLIKEEKRVDEIKYGNALSGLEAVCEKLNIKINYRLFPKNKKVIDYQDLYEILDKLIYETEKRQKTLINFASGTGQWKSVSMIFIDKEKEIFMIDVKQKEKEIEINDETKFNKLIKHIKEKILKHSFEFKDINERLVFSGIEKEKSKIDFFIKMIEGYVSEKNKEFFSYPLLVTGETGTGKSELIDYIENKLKSSGKKINFVKFNIAGLTSSIIESELFGHKKGAFTGAVEDKTGLIEKANNGVLFLDEIGDLNKELQVKLLRVLQNGKYKAVGSNEEETSNFVLISATNKDLETEIGNGNFREDLYWRINRIKIHLPSIKRRKDHKKIIKKFIENELNQDFKFFESLGYQIKTSIDDDIVDAVSEMNLQGNFRELQKMVKDAIFNNIVNKKLSVIELEKDDFNLFEESFGNDKTVIELIDSLAHELFMVYQKENFETFKKEYNKIGEAINYKIMEKLMRVKKLNQKNVAKELGLSDKTVSKFKFVYDEFLKKY